MMYNVFFSPLCEFMLMIMLFNPWSQFFFFGFVFVSLLHCSDGHKEWEVFSSVVFTTVVADTLLKIICQYFQLIFSGEYKQDH